MLLWGKRSYRYRKDRKRLQKRVGCRKGALEDECHLPRSTWLLPKQDRCDKARSKCAHCAQGRYVSSSLCGRAGSVRARAFRAELPRSRRTFPLQLRRSNRSCDVRSGRTCRVVTFRGKCWCEAPLRSLFRRSSTEERGRECCQEARARTVKRPRASQANAQPARLLP